MNINKKIIFIFKYLIYLTYYYFNQYKLNYLIYIFIL